MNVIKTIKDKFQKYGLIAFAILLFSFPYLNRFEMIKGIEPIQLIGLIIGFLSWIYLDLDKKLNELSDSSIAEKRHSFSEAIAIGLRDKSKISNLRIIGSTTGAILSNIISALSKDCVIENCTVIMKYCKSNRGSKGKVNRIADDKIARWNSLKENGVIQNLKVVKFDYEPINYTIIVDKKIAITGLYKLNSSFPSGYFSNHLSFLTMRKGAGEEKIDDLIEWFDEMVYDLEGKKKRVL